MKTSVTAYLALVALACLLPSGAAQNDAFEDCATTTFKMSNNKVFVGADVFKYVKLTTGQGTLDCMQLCRAYDECWSYNYDKTRKFCYLISQEGRSIKARRRYSWSAGYKVCVDHSDTSSWNNEPIDSATLAATITSIQVDIPGQDGTPDVIFYGTAAFSWASATGTATLNGASIPKYRVICGENTTDWTCDETGGATYWSSGTPTADVNFITTEEADLQAFWNFGNMKCYVETYINGIKTACSDAFTVNVNPMAAPLDWSITDAGDVLLTTDLPLNDAFLYYYAGCVQDPTLTCNQVFNSVNLKYERLDASSTTVSTVILSITTVLPGTNYCYFMVTNSGSGVNPMGCSPVTILDVPAR